jgi:hypothetical protein
MMSQAQKDDLARIVSLCSKLYCIPTDFDGDTRALTVSKSVLKRAAVQFQSVLSFAYLALAVARAVIVVKEGGLEYVIFHIAQVFAQFLTATFFWTSFEYKEELVTLYGYLQRSPEALDPGTYVLYWCPMFQ